MRQRIATEEAKMIALVILLIIAILIGAATRSALAGFATFFTGIFLALIV